MPRRHAWSPDEDAAIRAAPCPACGEKDRRIAQLERDLDAAATAVDTMTKAWMDAKEQKRK